MTAPAPGWSVDRPTLLGLAGVGLYVAALMLAMQHWPYDYWGALVVAPLLLAVSWPVMARLGRIEGDPWVANVLLLALVCKLLASLARFYTIFVAYDGSADASMYNDNGRRLAPLYLAGDFAADLGWPHFVGSGFIIVVTAIVYILIKPTLIGGFFVFAWLSFWGLVLAYRGFRLAVPDGDHRRYLVLVLFLPSLLFWPSSIGKEAWMSLAVGLLLYGSARVLTSRRGGFLVLGLGFAAASVVRPHVAALCAAGLVVAYLIKQPRRRTSLTPFVKLAGLAVVVALTVVVIQQAADFVGVEDVSAKGIQDTIETQGERTGIGDSAFTPTPLTSPLGLPMAAVTVLARPFPWEAHNLAAFIAAAEGLLLLLIVSRSLDRLRGLPRRLRRDPYVALSAVFVAGFIVAFSSFSNFGILARERTQLAPALLTLLCLPVAPADARRSPARTDQVHHEHPTQRARIRA